MLFDDIESINDVTPKAITIATIINPFIWTLKFFLALFLESNFI